MSRKRQKKLNETSHDFEAHHSKIFIGIYTTCTL